MSYGGIKSLAIIAIKDTLKVGITVTAIVLSTRHHSTG